MVKAEIHKRARGSAGGQAKARKAHEEEIELEDLEEHLGEDEGPVKVTNAAHVEGDILETDEYFDVPTVFTKEGVFTGTDGVPTLKTYDALKESAKWFVGTPITPKHIETDTIRPSDRRLGQVISAQAREDKRDVFGISRFYKSLLNEDEVHKIKNRTNLDGSPGYFVPTRSETGSFNGKEFQRIEEGPYVLGEYAVFFDGTRGACSSDDLCGPFQNARGKKKPLDPVDELLQAPPDLELVDGNVRKRCPKQKNEADQMVEEVEAAKAELTKQLNAANEKVTSLEGTVSELKKALDGLVADHKTLNEAFTGKVTAEATAKEAANKTEFKKLLNAAAATEIDAIWPTVKDLTPIEYEGWKITNSAKLLTEAEAKTLAGKKITNSADQVEAARAKADANLFKRR